jgi:hypothetical protein
MHTFTDDKISLLRAMRYSTMLPIGLSFAITMHSDEVTKFTPGITTTPAPITAESTTGHRYQLPERPFISIQHST